MSDMPNYTDPKPPTCAERISAHMASREAYLQGHYDLLDGDPTTDAGLALAQELGLVDAESVRTVEAEEAVRDSLDCFGLGVSAKVLVRVEISTGGPADYVEAVCEPTSSHSFQSREGEILAYVEPTSMTYHFADWWDHAETDVPEGSALWCWVADIVECGVAL